MTGFATLTETRALGSPVVRLFRAALGRDPDSADLAEYADRLRHGASVAELAGQLVVTDEFRLLHGEGSTADESFVDALYARVFGTGAPSSDRRAGLIAAALGGSRAELVATVADSAAGRALIPVLPGLAPGTPPDDPTAYRLWVAEYDSPAPEALARLPVLEGPRVSLLMSAGNTDTEAAIRTAESLRSQVYPDWELVLVARPISAWPRQALAALAEADPRIRLSHADPFASRTELLGSALATRTGTVAGVLAPGDVLAPTALYEAMAELQAHPEALLIYTDEDRLDGEVRYAPRFKPAYSPDAMLTGDAIGQLALYRAELLDTVGGLRPETWPHHTYDLAFRAAAAAGRQRVRHLPAVLCHRAIASPDWPVPAEALPRAAGGLDHVEPGPLPRARFRLPEPAPLVSVIVPTRNRAGLLAACASGVLDRTDYPALELLVVDNGSTEPEALELLARLAGNSRVRILPRPGPFNFAALNNAAAAEARGSVLVLLNNDTEILEPGWLRELVVHAARADVGAVGAKLLYPDGTLQHAGILLGPAGAATHVGRGARRDDPGYLGQFVCPRELSAVTAACLAMRVETWRAVGGMDESLAVTWNDIDLCLRVRAAGLRVIWTPHAVLLHREGVTRGLDAADPVRQARFREEQALVRARWGQALDCDPFLNPNLVATEAGPLSLTRPRHRRPWQDPAVALAR